MVDEEQEQEVDQINSKSGENDEQPVQEEDIIAKYFKGSNKEITTFVDVNNNQIVSEKVEEQFAVIMINVIGFKEIYEAWEN